MCPITESNALYPVEVRDFESSEIFPTSVIVLILFLAKNDTPAESYPLYSNLLKTFIALILRLFEFIIPTIPHMMFKF